MYNITTSDKRDENRGASNPVYNAPISKYPDSGDAFGKHILSLAIQPGNNTDDDNDGVVDKKDQCLGTPAGVKVDFTGCPVDTDGDGVADYLDKCPDKKGVKANNGCPEVKVEVKPEFH